MSMNYVDCTLTNSNYTIITENVVHFMGSQFEEKKFESQNMIKTRRK